MDRPKVLYRGISISAEKFLESEIHGDIVPHAPPILNEDGREVVADGNEYGIYLSTNKQVAQKAYGSAHMLGSVYNKESLFFDRYMQPQKIYYPQIGVVYEIDTKDIAIKKPWIRPEFEGDNAHYNNGFAGDEWIVTKSDKDSRYIIPSESYKISSIVMGGDLLNDEIKVEIDGLSDQEIKAKLDKMLSIRKEGYELFLEQVKTYPSDQRNKINSRMPIYKTLFNGQDGLAFVDYSKCDNENCQDVIRFLMQEVYKRDKITIDLDSLDLLNRLFGKVNTTDQLIQELTNLHDKLRVIINDPDANERIKVTSSVMITKVQNIRECLGIKMAENQAQPNN